MRLNTFLFPMLVLAARCGGSGPTLLLDAGPDPGLADASVDPGPADLPTLPDPAGADDGSGEPEATLAADEGPTGPYGTVIVSELMIRPKGAPDPDGEYVEVYNTTDDAIDLAGWVLEGQPGESVAIPGPLIVPPHGYRLLARLAAPAWNGW